MGEALQIGAEVYHNLKKVVNKKYGQDATNVGDEGGFAVPVLENNEALDVLMEAIKNSGHEAKVKLGTDVAASEFWTEDKMYDLDFKTVPNDGSMKKTGDEMIDYYKNWIANYPFVSIEDPFDQDDWESYSKFQAQIGDSMQIVGDDLLVTNPKRVQAAIDKKACNALLLKVNQIGSVTESIEACKMSQTRAGGSWCRTARARRRTRSSRTWSSASGPGRSRPARRAAPSASPSTTSSSASRRSSGPTAPSRARASASRERPGRLFFLARTLRLAGCCLRQLILVGPGGRGQFCSRSFEMPVGLPGKMLHHACFFACPHCGKFVARLLVNPLN